MKTFRLQIVTPDRLVYDGQAESIRIRTTVGDVQILAGHMDMVAALGIGKAKFRTENGEEKSASAAGGFLSVSGNEVKVIATTFELAEEIDLRRAESAKERAEAILQSAKDARQEELAKVRLARALNRISVGKGD